MRAYDAQKCSLVRQFTRFWNASIVGASFCSMHPPSILSLLSCFRLLPLPQVLSQMGKRVRYRCGHKNICINNKTTVMLFHELLSVSRIWRPNVGGPFSSLWGGAQAVDQSELEQRLITQLCGESSDSCCSVIDALVESGPIQLGGTGCVLSHLKSLTSPS